MIKKIFLETSIQIKRIWGDPVQRERIIDNLKNFDRIYTSSYCFAKYNRSILQDLKCLLEIVESNSNNNEAISLSELIRWIKKAEEEKKAYLSQRRLNRLLLIAVSLFEKQHFYYWNELKSKLYLLTYDEGTSMFFTVGPIKEQYFDIKNQPGCYIEEIKCDLIPPDIESSKQKRNQKLCEQLSCSRFGAKCNLIEFVKQHKTKLAKMEERLRKELKSIEKHKEKNGTYYRQLKVIEGVFNDLKNPASDYDFNKLLGQKNCWRLGDFIIVLEAYKVAPIYTIDKIYKVICEPDELYTEE